jgi:hypothetical protein
MEKTTHGIRTGLIPRTQIAGLYESFLTWLNTAGRVEVQLMFGVARVAVPFCWTGFHFAAVSVPRFLRPLEEAGHFTIGHDDLFLDGGSWDLRFDHECEFSATAKDDSALAILERLLQENKIPYRLTSSPDPTSSS